jgi:hypothetical protein
MDILLCSLVSSDGKDISNERDSHKRGMSVVSALSPLRQNSSKGNRTVKMTALTEI